MTFSTFAFFIELDTFHQQLGVRLRFEGIVDLPEVCAYPYRQVLSIVWYLISADLFTQVSFKTQQNLTTIRPRKNWWCGSINSFRTMFSPKPLIPNYEDHVCH